MQSSASANSSARWHRLPDARLEVFAGASHFFLLEQPERFNALLLDWLAQHA